jgi:hypothetical protein
VPQRDPAEAGYVGKRSDPSSDVAYTVAGVTAGQVTPETDATLPVGWRECRAELERRAAEAGEYAA